MTVSRLFLGALVVITVAVAEVNTMHAFSPIDQREALYEKLPSHQEKTDLAYQNFKKLIQEKSDLAMLDKAFLALLKSEDELGLIWSELCLYDSLVHDKTLRDRHQQSLEAIQKFSMEHLFDKDLYQAFQSYRQLLIASGDSAGLSRFCVDVLDVFIKDMNRSGTHLPKEQQEKLKEINIDLAQQAQHFQQNVLDAEEKVVFLWSEEQLKGLSDHQKSLLQKNEEGLYCIDRTALCRQIILEYLEDGALRKAYYQSCIQRSGPFDGLVEWDNDAIVENILKKRIQKANILGFDSYREYKLEERFAERVENVDNFYQQFLEVLPKKAEEEYLELKKFAQQSLQIDHLGLSDMAYVSRHHEENLLSIQEEQLKEYFPAHHVLEEFYERFAQLYGLKFEKIKDHAPLWHPDVFVVAVSDSSTEELLGYIYFDLFQRSGKRSGAWMDQIQSAVSYQDWKRVSDILCVGNFQDKNLWRSDEVQTLYHELGHSLHGLLSRHPLPPCSGIGRVPWDIVELPSMLSEQWSKQPQFLKTLGCHYKTQASLPAEWIEKIYSKERYGAGRFLLRQTLLGFFDWQAHSPTRSWQVRDLWKNLLKEYSSLPPLEEDSFPLTFGHIFAGGYACGYYSYLWADVYVHQVYKKMGKIAAERSWSEAGMAFRRAFLEKGGAASLKTDLRDFLEEDLTVHPLLDYYGLES